ncbi:folylpolyglutamate synthase [Ophiocordyceps sinensis CO18]|uniref:Folylpolyglutamate synthase n=1 Tax=Ophiocordyceps sinensis (strain Co18 / CGMCC 3.14243) TaxID=911162 RepID=T5AAA3_OPHSC|nr:folylpolyglutamate synthase [Ophiocordyceps sinensis CO18]
MARAVCGGCRAMSGGSARGYPKALEKLATLQSNRSTTLLFGGSGSGEQLNARALNARAIPEMKAWLRRAGYGPADLARMRHIHVAGTKGKGSVDAAPLLAALVAAVQRETRRRHVFRHALFTRNDHARHAAGAVVDMAVQEATAAAMAELVPGCDTACLDNVEDAVARARALAARLGHGRGVKPKVLVTGSLHLVGAFLRVLEPDVPL